MSKKSQNMHKARAVKNDEFYTQMSDIEKECSSYLEHFFDKVIYCNCDTADSNFVKYFMGLKQRGLIKDVIHTGGIGGLDFRSPESINLLHQADIVISNPPFSLFRDYVDQLTQYNKKFLIIGNINAISCKNIFSLIKHNKLWLGTRSFSRPMRFDLEGSIARKKIEIDQPVSYAIVSATWFTNLKYTKRDTLMLCKKYKGNEENYPKYENYDAININRIKDIPADYNGVMGVPITFIDKYNPEKFILLGLERDFTYDQKRGLINGKYLYARLFIQRRLN